MRTRVVVATIAVALALTGCSRAVPAPATRPVSSQPPTVSVPVEKPSMKLAPPPKGAYLGLFLPPAPFKTAKLDEYASISPKRPAILMWYQPWGKSGMNQFDAAACVAAFRRGAVPMITWEPWDPGDKAHYLKEPAKQPAFSLANVASGKYDAYMRGWARQIRDLGGPIMLRPMHEMNGNWYPWGAYVNGNTPDQFKAAWRHMHDLFEAEGATNVTWVWSVNRESVPATSANTYASYYPGDSYVDWTALSGFNWGTSRAQTSWASFAKTEGHVLPYLETLDKPIVIAEFACVESGGDKAAWITDAYEKIRTEHPAVRAVVYYDSLEKGPRDTQDWQIDSSRASVGAYRTAIGDPYYLAGPAEALSSWQNALTDSDQARLRGYQHIY